MTVMNETGGQPENNDNSGGQNNTGDFAGFDSKEELITAYDATKKELAGVQSLIGADKILIPGKDANDEDRTKFNETFTRSFKA